MKLRLDILNNLMISDIGIIKQILFELYERGGQIKLGLSAQLLRSTTTITQTEYTQISVREK